MLFSLPFQIPNLWLPCQTYIHIHIHTHTQITYIQTHICTYINKYVYTQIHLPPLIHTDIHTQARVPICRYVITQTHDICKCIHTDVNTHEHTHTLCKHMYTCTHAYIPIRITLDALPYHLNFFPTLLLTSLRNSGIWGRNRVLLFILSLMILRKVCWHFHTHLGWVTCNLQASGCQERPSSPALCGQS